jgi:hypothetical protein
MTHCGAAWLAPHSAYNTSEIGIAGLYHILFRMPGGVWRATKRLEVQEDVLDRKLGVDILA